MTGSLYAAQERLMAAIERGIEAHTEGPTGEKLAHLGYLVAWADCEHELAIYEGAVNYLVPPIRTLH